MVINLTWKCIQFLASFFGPANNTYFTYTKFSGMKGPINCLSFSHGGELLASGSEYFAPVFSKAVWDEPVAGDDETVRILEIPTKKCLQILEDPGKRWGQITCLTWLGNWGNDDLKPIAFGTGRGLMVIYRRYRIDAPMVELASNRIFEASDPVESIAFDAKKSLLAITSHYGRIALYDIGRNGTMSEVWTVRSDPLKKASIPRSIQFYEGGEKILIFYLETGEMVCRDTVTAREDWRRVLKSGIGNVSIYSSKLLLVDNLSKGFDLYDLPRSSPSCTFAVPNEKKCVKDGAFAEKASTIVCGTDHGKVYVFSMESSVPVQVLTAARKTVEVQAIGTTTTSEAHFIASGSSAKKSEIIVWEKPIKRAKRHTENDLSNGRVVTLLYCILILTFLGWTSGFWGPIASQAAIQTVRAMDRVLVQIAGAGVQTDKPNITEWVARPPVRLDDEDEAGEDDGIQWRGHLDKL